VEIVYPAHDPIIITSKGNWQPLQGDVAFLFIIITESTDHRARGHDFIRWVGRWGLIVQLSRNKLDSQTMKNNMDLEIRICQ
jgi:hypothetical protein